MFKYLSVSPNMVKIQPLTYNDTKNNYVKIVQFIILDSIHLVQNSIRFKSSHIVFDMYENFGCVNIFY